MSSSELFCATHIIEHFFFVTAGSVLFSILMNELRTIAFDSFKIVVASYISCFLFEIVQRRVPSFQTLQLLPFAN